MRSTIDRAGRVVVPKKFREVLGWTEGAAVEISLDEGRVVIEARRVAKSLQLDADGPVIVADDDLATMTADDVRDILEATRH
jgi:AbrB family looped-hinge helix DNA binding protein